VSFLYLDAEPSKVLVTQFRADLDEGFFKKVDVRGGDIAYPEVNGTHGYWIAGDPHLFYYVADGRFLEETIRLVGHVLLWEEGDITYRIEGSDSLARALEIAASLR
jgi:hypothetical protein